MPVAPALSEPRISTESKGRNHLETLLRHRKLDHTLWGLTPSLPRGADPTILQWLVPTGLTDLDARLEGALEGFTGESGNCVRIDAIAAEGATVDLHNDAGDLLAHAHGIRASAWACGATRIDVTPQDALRIERRR